MAKLLRKELCALVVQLRIYVADIVRRARLGRKANKITRYIEKDAVMGGKQIQTSLRVQLLSKVTNPKLRRIIDQCYRENALFGSGSLADVIRHELRTGEPISHGVQIQKGKGISKSLSKDHRANSTLERDTVIPALLIEFPNFAKSVDIEDGVSQVLGDFGIYLRDGITSGTIETDELNNAFSFLNAMGARDDNEIPDLLQVEILEILTDSDETILVAKKKLENQALELFEWTLSIWNPGWYTRR